MTTMSLITEESQDVLPPTMDDEQTADIPSAPILGEPVGTRVANTSEGQVKVSDFDPSYDEELLVLIPNHLRDPEEDNIRFTPVIEFRKLGGGVSVTRLAFLEDGSIAVFKPVSGEPQLIRDNLPAGTHYKRERAAFIISQLLDFDIVPATVIRKLEGELGSVQDFVDGSVTAAESHTRFLSPEYKEARAMMAIFDFIIWNSDRHKGNFMVSDTSLHAIDNGLSFGPVPQLSVFAIHDEDIPESVITKLRNFKEWPENIQVLRSFLAPLLEASELEACLVRLSGIIDILTKHGQLPQDVVLEYAGITNPLKEKE